MPRTRASALHGFLAIDKPRGWTSHDVVAKVRRMSGVRRVGHAGTLDPFATGLLIVGVGKATRLIQYVQSSTKTYEATLKLGQETTTLDPEGEVCATYQGDNWPLFDEVVASVSTFQGSIEQIPPAYSAIHVDGRRAYDRARAGEAVDIPPRRVVIQSVEVTRYAPPYLDLTISCSTGTYIRSLARDIGRELETYAYCAELRRMASGSFHVADAVSIAQLEVADFRDVWSRSSLAPDSAVEDFPPVVLQEQQSTAWYHGQSLAGVGLEAKVIQSNHVRVYDASGNFAGLGLFNDDCELRPVLVFTLD